MTDEEFSEMKQVKCDFLKGYTLETIQLEIDNLSYGYEMLSYEERQEVNETLKDLHRRKRHLQC